MRIEISIDKVKDGISYPDKGLEQKLQLALEDINISDYLRGIVEKTLDAVNGESEPIDYLGIRIVTSRRPNMGFSFKTFRVPKVFPSIVIGFSGNLVEFQKTIIHEILHFVDWDEYMLDKKAEEIMSKDEKDV